MSRRKTKKNQEESDDIIDGFENSGSEDDRIDHLNDFKSKSNKKRGS